MRKPDTLSKWLHIGMAACIVLCTTMGLAMDVRGKIFTLEVAFFVLHKFIGLDFILIASIYLLWSSTRNGKPLTELFPWFNAEARQAVLTEVRAIRRVKARRLFAMTNGFAALAGAIALGAAGRAGYLTLHGAALAHDVWLRDLPLFLALGAIGYGLFAFPWFNRNERAGLAREIQRLTGVSTHHIASAVQGFGVTSGLVASLIGLWIVMLIIFGAKFTADMMLPRLHYWSAMSVLAYLAVHAGAALLHRLAGHREIFAIGHVLDRTLMMTIDPHMMAANPRKR